MWHIISKSDQNGDNIQQLLVVLELVDMYA
jgi:hypothetical protein